MHYKKLILAPNRTLSGGVGTYTKEFLKKFNDFEVISGQNSHVHIGTNNVISIDGFETMPSFKMFYNFYKFAKKNNAETIIYQGTLSLIILPILKMLWPSATHIIIFHGLASKYTSYLVHILEKFSAKLANKIVFLTKNDLKKFGKTKKTNIIYNYAKKQPKNLSDFNNSTISTVTRVSKQKNLNYCLLDIQLQNMCKLNVYGVDKNQFKEKNYPNVIFCGRADLYEMYAGKFAFTLSTYSEGFPLSILEAAEFGLPLILSDIPELREICGDNALYFQNDLTGSLSDIIILLKNNKSMYDEYSLKSRKLTDKYSIEKWQNNWEKCLNL